MLAVVVRVAGVDHRLVHDEGYSWLVGSAPSAGSFLKRLADFENTPPLYYVLLAPLPLNDEPWIRLPALIAGVALVPIVYVIAQRALGTRTALLAALALAVAPYAVANSDFARGFMLADFGLLLALWAAVRLAEGCSERWWLLYAAGAVLALYSEYDAAMTLAPLVVGLVLLVREAPRGRWRAAGLGVLPAVALAPWAHELSRSLAERHLKTGGGYLTVTPGVVRDQIVPLFYGETGQNAGAALRSGALVVLVAALAYGFYAMARHGRTARPLRVLVAWTLLGTLVAHALAPAVGIGIFNVRYLTILIPLGCILLAEAVAAVPIRAAVPIACVGLAGVGLGVTVRRFRHEPEPDPHVIADLVGRAGAQTVLTNSAVVAYYLRAQHVILDRPLGLGRGLEGDCARCPRPLAVVDDAGVGAGPRPGPGPTWRVGHYVVRAVP